MAIGMHGEPAAEGLADAGELHGGAEAAPKMMIAQNDVFRAEGNAAGYFFKRGGAHISGQGNVQRLSHFGHIFLSPYRVFEVFEPSFHFAAVLNGRFHLPQRIGVEA